MAQLRPRVEVFVYERKVDVKPEHTNASDIADEIDRMVMLQNLVRVMLWTQTNGGLP